MEPDNELSHEPMKLSDLDEVLFIERASFSVPWSRKMFLEEMSNSHARLVVFRLDSRLVGYLIFWAVLDEAHLLNIAVHPEHRGNGFGVVIMSHLERYCRDNKLVKILLEVGRKNAIARNLYKRSGFTSIGFRKKYYQSVQDDAIVMEKVLSNSQEST